MKFDILTTFPNSFSVFSESIIKRAVNNLKVEIKIHNLRDFATDSHKTTDDSPFGGGAGMLMKIEPIYLALKSLGVYPKKDSNCKIILTSAKGTTLNQNLVQEFRQNLSRLVIICGHYEGVDSRVSEYLIDQEISIGNYVLSGGEIPAMVIVDSITRLVPGVLGNSESIIKESHSTEFLKEYPQYTRPAVFKTEEGLELKVPDVLLSGNHALIEEWQKNNSI